MGNIQSGQINTRHAQVPDIYSGTNCRKRHRSKNKNSCEARTKPGCSLMVNVRRMWKNSKSKACHRENWTWLFLPTERSALENTKEAE